MLDAKRVTTARWQANLRNADPEIRAAARDMLGDRRQRQRRGVRPLSARPNALAFAATPAVGTAVIWQGQTYTLAAVEPYARPDGTPSQILVWRSPCWECSAPFEMRRSLGGARGLNRRCVRHKRPGARVRIGRAA
jgi:hypothetical protein